MATASDDRSCKIWDIRNLSLHLYELRYHFKELTRVAWSPSSSTYLATSGMDRKVCIWDMARINQTPTHHEDGPPELVFIHGGHTDIINDICWNPQTELTIGSVGYDNIVQVWTMNHDIFGRPAKNSAMD